MRVGARILALLEHADWHGTVDSAELRKLWPDVNHTNCCKYLSRAEAMGLIVETEEKHYPRKYTAAPGWKVRIFGTTPRKYEWSGKYSATAIKERQEAKRKSPHGSVNSVFALGALHE
jgi:hypothetical protein